MDQELSSRSDTTHLSASLAPFIASESEDQSTLVSDLMQRRSDIEDTLAEFGGILIDLPGSELVARFESPSDAVSCALQMERIIGKHNNNQLPMDRLVLGIGVHIHDDESAEESSEAHHISAGLCGMAARTGGVFTSESVYASLKGKPNFRFEDMGSWPIEGEAEPIHAYQISQGASASDVVGSLAQGFSEIPIAAVVLTAGIIVMVLSISFDFSGINLRGINFQEMEEWEVFQPPPPDSIAVLPFTGGGYRSGGESYGDSIPTHVIDSLNEFDGIDVSSRGESFAFRNQTDDIGLVGKSLGVEGVVRGYASTSGDWILVRAALIRIDDGSQIWSGAYYKRVSELESVQEEMIQGIAAALEISPKGRGLPSVAAANPATGKQQTRKEEDYSQLKVELEDALKKAQRLDISDPERASSLNSLAALYYDSGRDAEAVPIYQQVLEIRVRTLGVDHPEVAVALNNLASVYMATGQYNEAEPLYLRSLEIREKAFGTKHERVANALNNLASLYHRQGRLTEAEGYYSRALDIRGSELELELGPEASRLRDRGVRHELSGQFPEAQRYYQKSLDSEVESSGATHVRTASATRTVAKVQAMQGNYAGAESMFERALSIFSGSLGDDHTEVGRTLADLGELHRRNGRLVEAERYHERSVETLSRSLGPDHPEVAGGLGYLVSIFEVQGREGEAAEARKRQKTIRKMYMGPVFSYVAARSKGPRVARDRINDDLSMPQPLHEYQVTIEEGEHVSEKRRYAESLHSLALLYVEQGRYAQAEANNMRALEIREALSGRSHPDVAMSLHSLARIYALQGRVQEATQYYSESRQIFETTLGRVHPHVARCWEDLAQMLRESQRSGEAELADQKAREIRMSLAPQASTAG